MEGSDTAQPETPKVVVVMPAMNAAATLERTFHAIPRDIVSEVILVDDSSTDATAEVARSLPLHFIWHPHNVGYGGNQKTCYLTALQRGADIVLGSRLAEPGAARRGGMPLIKRVANRGLTAIENRLMGTHATELHTGYRAYSRRFLMTVPFLRNALDFSFDSEVLMQASAFGMRIAEVPANSRYFDDASSIGLRPATVYALKTLWAGFRLVLHRRGLWRSRKYSL